MDPHYSEDVDLLDSLVEFHPEWIDKLSADEIAALDNYYGFHSLPVDLPAWRALHVERDSTLQDRAQAILRAFPGLTDD